jgi:hypothetical protein
MGIGCSRGEVAQGGLGEAPLEAIVHAICTGKEISIQEEIRCLGNKEKKIRVWFRAFLHVGHFLCMQVHRV